MNTAARLAAYGAGLAVAFAAAFATAAAVVPESAVTDRQNGTTMKHDAGHGSAGADGAAAAAGHGAGTSHAPAGTSLSAGGYVLSAVQAPSAAGGTGDLSFRILHANGTPVTAYRQQHEKDLHLIVVRSDGSRFRHVHPALDVTTGTWSIPWTWDAGGSYRVFADFRPAGAAEGVTLTRTVDVAGELRPASPSGPRTVDTVDGYRAELTGDLVAGGQSDLRVTLTRDGAPVTTLQPYLGAFGHLVALREGDLAYLHVHAEGDEPRPGQTSGPTVDFAAHAPTAGRYLLYLDFQVQGTVRTATFVLDAAPDGHH
ncbi:heavy-metal-associated domain-containing protein [Tsukamurella sp. 8F]|uniref:heavy-metal-associated domain-containing protein n=1 Tax=unclassified Tsukamurella TaxID=2633480 RepID=UPI0023BA02E0|nr:MULTISPECIES: heavy-metal-associated domain-containing protein [unclassified Tsukamurella]MDF0532168.1 heavy-metal-associated domain-containing protein [Tsukamurella sp. 8J]MDF0587979.1 heavy-metal-associated domain-containing protein [Tsukamurella sp. 8F]